MPLDERRGRGPPLHPLGVSLQRGLRRGQELGLIQLEEQGTSGAESLSCSSDIRANSSSSVSGGGAVRGMGGGGGVRGAAGDAAGDAGGDVSGGGLSAHPATPGPSARLRQLPEPDEPRHAGVGRLFEQMLEVAPKPGRDPLGDARLDPALRLDQRVGAEPFDRRRGRQDGFACVGRRRRTCGPGPRSTAPVPLLRGAGLRAHAPHRPRRTGIRTGGAAQQDDRAGSRTAPRSRRGRPRPGRAGVR